MSNTLVLPSPSSTAFEQSMSALVSHLRTKMDDSASSADLYRIIQTQLNARSSSVSPHEQNIDSSANPVNKNPFEITNHLPSLKAPSVQLTVNTNSANRKALSLNPKIAQLKSPQPPSTLISPTTAARSIFSFDGRLPSPSVPGGKSHVITVSGTSATQHVELKITTHPGSINKLHSPSLLTPITRLLTSLSNTTASSSSSTNISTGAPGAYQTLRPKSPPMLTPVTRILNSLGVPQQDHLATAVVETSSDPTVDYVMGNFMDTINTLAATAPPNPLDDILPASTNASSFDFTNLTSFEPQTQSAQGPTAAVAFSNFLASSLYDTAQMDAGVSSFDAFHALLEKQQIEQMQAMDAQMYTQYRQYQQQHVSVGEGMQARRHAVPSPLGPRMQQQQPPSQGASSMQHGQAGQFKQPFPVIQTHFHMQSQHSQPQYESATTSSTISTTGRPTMVASLIQRLTRQSNSPSVVTGDNRPVISSPLSSLVPPDSPLSSDGGGPSPTTPHHYAPSQSVRQNSYTSSPLSTMPAFNFPTPPQHRQESDPKSVQFHHVAYAQLAQPLSSPQPFQLPPTQVSVPQHRPHAGTHPPGPTSHSSSTASLLKCSVEGCKKFFKKQESLAGHMATAHGHPLALGDLAAPTPTPATSMPMIQSSGNVEEVKPAFQCDKCDQTFSRVHDLKRHSYTHSANRPFSCSRCGKGFARRDVLRKHEMAVEEGKKVACVPMSEVEVGGKRRGSGESEESEDGGTVKFARH